ncbi:hypothetical protein AX774_g5521 [Zancudomyces culisetae]|uniref:Uncharacterized protein n=1 Tax=Zancudomyces culisetae TaxID=1213189 RepID=A0A1R1PJ96_ZANCU|nr:hypothetical protein AX774_g5521 [Zancudomyces culisetae]|eukprot:OMH81028.1 hypothetical protein AX774_g5521 [Zancudomyces culisetae]
MFVKRLAIVSCVLLFASTISGQETPMPDSVQEPMSEPMSEQASVATEAPGSVGDEYPGNVYDKHESEGNSQTFELGSALSKVNKSVGDRYTIVRFDNSHLMTHFGPSGIKTMEEKSMDVLEIELNKPMEQETPAEVEGSEAEVAEQSSETVEHEQQGYGQENATSQEFELTESM